MPLAVFESIPDGFRGTEATIRKMHQLAHQGKVDLTIQKVADCIISRSGCGDRDYNCKAKAIYDFVKRCIRFERDPFGVEMVQEPVITLHRKAGDCDDHSILIGSLLGSIGFPYAFKTIKADDSRPDEFTHVYAVGYVPSKGWVGMDTSVGVAYYGWEPKRYKEAKVWPARVA